jgi:hypothetical protein
MIMTPTPAIQSVMYGRERIVVEIGSKDKRKDNAGGNEKRKRKWALSV